MNDVRQSSKSQNDSGKPLPGNRPRRSWYRLHFSTWIVAGAVLAVLALIVVPGRLNNHDIFTAAPLDYEHGWPFVFMYRATIPQIADDLKECRDQEGLRGGMDREKWSDDGFQRDGPAWLDRDNWPLKGEVAISATGLVLDLAVVFIILAAVAVAYEWWARRRWRYSLRSLLGVTLLVAVALAWWRLSMNRYDGELQGVATLSEKKSRVFWHCDAPICLRMLIGAKFLRFFHHVVAVFSCDEGKTADDSAIVDADLEHIHKLTHLQHLQLDYTRITDAGLDYIKGLPELEVLFLDGTQVTDKGLKHLHDLPRLRFLTLDYTRITGDGLRYLKDLPQLQDLSLEFTWITDDALPHLQALPELQDLNLSHTKITNRGVPYLKALKKLKTLNLFNTKITAEGVKRLRQALPNCKIELED